MPCGMIPALLKGRDWHIFLHQSLNCQVSLLHLLNLDGWHILNITSLWDLCQYSLLDFRRLFLLLMLRIFSGHEESYNPSLEYIPTQEEINSYQLMFEEDRPKFIPKRLLRVHFVVLIDVL